ncbi:hypothetical protein TNCT_397031 [Trichonephila clavata]|uniref:Uncharacterized protein n=1 Tax=Trichonephila clavata TaxID=2740835 RepID=A0A8X6FRU0_TRICU|nr:hypothetical protein TNCT_397031 [Trichonephila clavata]
MSDLIQGTKHLTVSSQIAIKNQIGIISHRIVNPHHSSFANNALSVNGRTPIRRSCPFSFNEPHPLVSDIAFRFGDFPSFQLQSTPLG